MQPSYVWFSLAVLLIIAELTTGTFYLLMVALGLAAGGVAAMAGLAFPAQAALAALVGVIAILLLRRSRFGKTRRAGSVASNPDVNLDIGEEVSVAQWGADRRARVSYRGAEWDVELAGDQPPAPGRFRIVELRGNTLIVKPRQG
ncbi:NfeD family protein [Imbroritus primus]|uniref:NfeD family protein n=1 Tax=Imbroritus primus TaxID=3058603 RepID=A0ACD3SRI9_9BURK|nr:NfeD family protein [Burkholderiaceae bacterium PBA]